MDLELRTSQSVTNLLRVVRTVRTATQAKLSDLPDSDSNRYRYLKGFESELDRLIQGKRTGGKLELRPLADRLSEQVPTDDIFREANAETAADLNSAIGPSGPIGLRLGVPLIDARALAFLEDYKFELLSKQSAVYKADIKSALRLGIIQGDGGSAITRSLSLRHPLAADRFERIVRTELARAQSEGHLQGYTELGVTRVEAIGRGLDCPICGQHIGHVFLIERAPRLPFHPNCRCDYVAVERGAGNWLVTQRQLDDAHTLSLPDDYRVTPAVLRQIAQDNPDAIYAWPEVPKVLSHGSLSSPESLSYRRSKPFLGGLRRFTLAVDGKQIVDARLSRQ
jgi:hypothetical protein